MNCRPRLILVLNPRKFAQKVNRMDPVNSLAIQLSLTSLTSLPDEVACDAEVQILECFKPYICESQQLADIKQMSSRAYYQLEPSGLFTAQEAAKIAKIIAGLLIQNTGSGSYYLPRKTSAIDWKILITTQDSPTVQKVVFLLPKKLMFHDLIGNTKRGRVSLLCSQESSTSTWKSAIIWNLTGNAGKTKYFLESRALEKKLHSVHGPGYFAEPLCDFAYANSADRRTCFYERLKCLIFLDKQLHVDKLQRVLLHIAQKLDALHKKDTVIVDLKRENTLVAKDFSVLFCDIDQIMFNQFERKAEHGGTKEFYPPELLEYGFTEGKAGDVFAFGCMILELLLGSGPPWLASKAERKIDRGTLDKYRKQAVQARIVLEGGLVTSAPKALFCIAQWALHPWRTERPDMAALCKLLERQYKGQEALTDADVQAYLSIEK